VDKANVSDPDCGEKVKTTEPNKTLIFELRCAGRPAVRDNSATETPSASTSELDQLFEKILPAFVKIVKPSASKFNGNPLEYSKFKAALKVEVDKKGVYDETERLKFLLDAVKGSAKSCLSKFMSGSDKYKEAWTALDESCGRVDKIVSACERGMEKFLVIGKENSEQIRQYQGVVSELIGLYKEHNFVHELNSQIPETVVAKPPMHLCRRWAEFIEGKPKLSTWQSFGNWLEKRQKSVSLSSSGCPIRKNGSGLTRLKNHWSLWAWAVCTRDRRTSLTHRRCGKEVPNSKVSPHVTRVPKV